MTKEAYEKWSRIIALSLKVLGILGIVFVVVFWAFTQKVELAFLPFFGTLVGVGQGVDVLREISENRPPTPVGVSPTTPPPTPLPEAPVIDLPSEDGKEGAA